ncbi:phage tail assembly chaperone G [Schleiferilactobacillus shenzhenensis]|nr:hypothetical protein [Schleiferilactobacillus shenzhenensis]
MAYKIKINKNGKVNEYIRNEDPDLRDMTNALKVEQQQIRMYGRPEGPTNEDFDINEANLAAFAVRFWHNQFSAQEVIDGATAKLDTLTSINVAVGDALNDPDSTKPEDVRPKKSPSPTSTKASVPSTTITKRAYKRATRSKTSTK